VSRLSGTARRKSCFFSSRRRHTRSKRDWSSDVRSSDLAADLLVARGAKRLRGDEQVRGVREAAQGVRARRKRAAEPPRRSRVVRSEERRVGKVWGSCRARSPDEKSRWSSCGGGPADCTE